MPNVLYKWDFETGDTQGWILGSYVTLSSEAKIQGTYSLKYSRHLSGGGTYTDDVGYISGVDLQTATRPILIFVSGVSSILKIVTFILEVYDSDGTLLYTRSVTAYITDGVKIIVIDLLPVAGRTNLTIKIKMSYSGTAGYTYTWYIDNIYIIDGADKVYDIALLAVYNMDRTLVYEIPEADKALDPTVAGFAVALLDPPHPLNESKDVFRYTAVTDEGSTYIQSTDSYYRYISGYVSSSPTTFLRLEVRVFVTTAGTTYLTFDREVLVTFWTGGYDLSRVCLFRVAMTINPYSPLYATAMTNTRYGSTWSGSRDFDVKVYGRGFGVRCCVRYLVGDNTVVQSGTVKVEMFSEDYNIKYGESSVDITTGTVIRGPFITDLPPNTPLKLRISWTIVALARIVIEVRPEFLVY